MSPAGGILWPSLRAYQVWGAGADVGKTTLTNILCLSVGHRRPHEHAVFFEPVAIGPNEKVGYKQAQTFFRKKIGAKPPKDRFNASSVVHYEQSGSPHIVAAQSDQEAISDTALTSALFDLASKSAINAPPKGTWLFCETYGGVHSPAPSGTSQVDLYRPLRIPAILIADHKPGGISATISAFESLRMRGYDVESVLLFKTESQNEVHLTSYFEKFGIPCVAVPHPPVRDEDPRKDKSMTYHYLDATARSNVVKQLLRDLEKHHDNRINALRRMPEEAHKLIWYPSTQQKLLTPDDITAVDSAYRDNLQTVLPDPLVYERTDPRTIRKNTRLKQQIVRGSHLRTTFDGTASWWTQGLGHANPQLTLAAAYAAGRFGNVTSTELIHHPSLEMAKSLLRKSENPRLARVLYSDDGPAGIEMAIRMAFRASRLRYGWGSGEELSILGLKGSHYGDVVDAVESSEPGVHHNNGHWLDFPTIQMTDGQWLVDVPGKFSAFSEVNASTAFQSLDAIFNVQERDGTELAQTYESYIVQTLEGLQKEGRKLGALILEPVVLADGGMLLVDPLFQRVLVNVIRSKPQLFPSATTPASKDNNDWTGLPVVFDEEFTGLYRLGRYSSASFLGVHPDISVLAKPVTGGLAPVVATVASESIFQSFEIDDEDDALSHGHNHTAQPTSCQVALESLSILRRMEKDGAWKEFQSRWDIEDGAEASAWSVWGQDFVQDLSIKADGVEGVWALGSLLAIKFEGAGESAANALQAELFRGTGDLVNPSVHAQVSGNVLYLLASQTSELETIEGVENHLLQSKVLFGERVGSEEAGLSQEEEEVEL
ncbi:hypothetical protein SLS53_000546 [Cytospora paraplurivora]|uniref:Uncharacterized protein n=1 Tax=Cytospora paraplurivora TaxID=2898453 RepID=A0AAN9UID5_9PEZI